MEGWIKLHRSINKHWIFKDSEKLKAWITILLNVNHEENKVNLGNLLLTCKRGESLKSLDSWSKLFGNQWNKSKVRRFFELLKNDSMIELKNEHKTTRLIVCKYDTYQETRNTSETQTKRKRNANETQTTPNKNDKNDKNEKEVVVEKTYTAATEILGLINSLSKEKIDSMIELTLYKGDFEELKKKFAVEFIGRYGLNKTENEVLETLQSWMSRDKQFNKIEETNHKLDTSKLK